MYFSAASEKKRKASQNPRLVCSLQWRFIAPILLKIRWNCSGFPFLRFSLSPHVQSLIVPRENPLFLHSTLPLNDDSSMPTQIHSWEIIVCVSPTALLVFVIAEEKSYFFLFKSFHSRTYRGKYLHFGLFRSNSDPLSHLLQIWLFWVQKRKNLFFFYVVSLRDLEL